MTSAPAWAFITPHLPIAIPSYGEPLSKPGTVAYSTPKKERSLMKNDSSNFFTILYYKFYQPILRTSFQYEASIKIY
jgi:hypothetical protein